MIVGSIRNGKTERGFYSCMEEKIDVSIIIVSYNTVDLTIHCIESIYAKTQQVSFEVIVVDNGSKDNTVQRIKDQFKKVRVIETGKNLGFGKANNIGLKEARGKYILYLNSDTILLNNGVKDFFDYFEIHSHENIGAIGSLLLDKDNKISHSYGHFPTYMELCRIQAVTIIINMIKWLCTLFHLEKKYVEWTAKKPDREEAYYGDVDYITGADLFMKNNSDAFFDPIYFMYSEEVDLEKKLAVKNLRRVIIPGPMIIHYQDHNREQGKMQLPGYPQIFQEISNIEYSKKHFGHNAKLLRILTKMDFLNPIVRPLVKPAKRIIAESIK